MYSVQSRNWSQGVMLAQIWKLGVNVKRQRTPSDVNNTSCVIGL